MVLWVSYDLFLIAYVKTYLQNLEIGEFTHISLTDIKCLADQFHFTILRH